MLTKFFNITDSSLKGLVVLGQYHKPIIFYVSKHRSPILDNYSSIPKMCINSNAK